MFKFCFRLIRNLFALIGFFVFIWVFFVDEKGNSQLIESWNSLNTFIQDDSKNRTVDSNVSQEIPKAEPVCWADSMVDP